MKTIKKLKTYDGKLEIYKEIEKNTATGEERDDVYVAAQNFPAFFDEDGRASTHVKMHIRLSGTEGMGFWESAPLLARYLTALRGGVVENLQHTEGRVTEAAPPPLPLNQTEKLMYGHVSEARSQQWVRHRIVHTLRETGVTLELTDGVFQSIKSTIRNVVQTIGDKVEEEVRREPVENMGADVLLFDVLFLDSTGRMHDFGDDLNVGDVRTMIRRIRAGTDGDAWLLPEDRWEVEQTEQEQ
jgi:hypothetical protein